MTVRCGLGPEEQHEKRRVRSLEEHLPTVYFSQRLVQLSGNIAA